MGDLLRRRAMMVNKPSRLPAGYREVEFIESDVIFYYNDGGPCIDTGFCPNQNTRVFIRATKRAWSFMTRDALKSKDYSLWFTGEGSVRYCFGNREKQVTPSTMDWDAITEVDCNKRTFTFSNGSYTASATNNAATFTCTRSLILFGARETSTGDTKYINGRMYEAKIWDNDVLAREFVPCYRTSDGEIGMYDLATNEFFANAGPAGSAFLKGGNV